VAVAAVVNSTVAHASAPSRLSFHIVVSNWAYLDTLGFHSSDPAATPSLGEFEVELLGRLGRESLRGAQLQLYDLEGVSRRLQGLGYRLPWLLPEFQLPDNEWSMRSQGRASRFWGEHEPEWELFSNEKHKHPLNHLRFYLPYLLQEFEGEEQLMFIDDDIVLQRDIIEIWEGFDLEGKVMGATCVFPKVKYDKSTGTAQQLFEIQRATENLWALNLPSATSVRDLQRKACRQNLAPVEKWKQETLRNCLPTSFLPNLNEEMLRIEGKRLDLNEPAGFNFGFNKFDLRQWEATNLTGKYEQWLELNTRERIWAPDSMGYGLGLGWLALYGKIHCWDHKLDIIEGLSVDTVSFDIGDGQRGQQKFRIPMKYLEEADLLHFNGDSKPWGTSRIAAYYPAWAKYVRINHPIVPREVQSTTLVKRIRELDSSRARLAAEKEWCLRPSIGPVSSSTSPLIWLQYINSASVHFESIFKQLMMGTREGGLVLWDCSWPKERCKPRDGAPFPSMERWKHCQAVEEPTQCDNMKAQLTQEERRLIGALHGPQAWGAHEALGVADHDALYMLQTVEPTLRLSRLYKHVVHIHEGLRNMTFEDFLEQYPIDNEVTKLTCGPETVERCWKDADFALAKARHNVVSARAVLVGDFVRRPADTVDLLLGFLGLELPQWDREHMLATATDIRRMLQGGGGMPEVSTRAAKLLQQRFWADFELHRFLTSVMEKQLDCTYDKSVRLIGLQSPQEPHSAPSLADRLSREHQEPPLGVTGAALRSVVLASMAAGAALMFVGRAFWRVLLAGRRRLPPPSALRRPPFMRVGSWKTK